METNLLQKKNEIDKELCLFNNLLIYDWDLEFQLFLIKHVSELESKSKELSIKLNIKQKGFSYV